MPRIRSKLARIEPSSEAWTIRISFCTSQQQAKNGDRGYEPWKEQCCKVKKRENVSIGLLQITGNEHGDKNKRNRPDDMGLD